MAEAIDFEIRKDAAYQWIENGFTYEAIAARYGMSVGCLKKWADDEGWSEQRRAARQKKRDDRVNFDRMRSALILKATASLNPQDVYAVCAVETILQRAVGKSPSEMASASASPETLREIKTPE